MQRRCMPRKSARSTCGLRGAGRAQRIARGERDANRHIYVLQNGDTAAGQPPANASGVAARAQCKAPPSTPTPQHPSTPLFARGTLRQGSQRLSRALERTLGLCSAPSALWGTCARGGCRRHRAFVGFVAQSLTRIQFCGQSNLILELNNFFQFASEPMVHIRVKSGHICVVFVATRPG